jgi:hypothetical protein
MKIALVITAKNEERLLRQNLLYHRAIGVYRAFVYFDNTTDRGKESIADLDFVKTEDSVPTEKYTHLDALKKFTSQAKEHHTARQCLNTFDALQQCQQEGIDWLISIDADELVCTDIDEPSQLSSFFKNIDGDVDVVYFNTLEAVQRQLMYDRVFEDESLFKVQRSGYFKKLFNPFTNSKQKFSWWYGQTMGKGAMRVQGKLIPHNVHRYKNSNGKEIKSLKKGFVLHYHAYDAQDFIKKFKNFSDHPNTFLSGNKVEDIKLLLRDVVNTAGYNEEDLIQYYKDNLLFTPPEIEKLKQKNWFYFFPKKALLLEIQSVSKTFKKLVKGNENH